MEPHREETQMVISWLMKFVNSQDRENEEKSRNSSQRGTGNISIASVAVGRSTTKTTVTAGLRRRVVFEWRKRNVIIAP